MGRSMTGNATINSCFIALLAFASICCADDTIAGGGLGEEGETSAVFEEAASAKWQEVFFDAGTGNWDDLWFLDGEVGTVTNHADGMELAAGPEFKNDAHHTVLWTRDTFSGDLKIEFEYTRLDDETRCVNILYIQATGSGKGKFANDISKWNDLRRVPSMRTY